MKNLTKDLYIEGKNVTKIVKALSNENRINILNILNEKECNIQELTAQLKLSKTAVIAHINVLEEAGFITTQYINGSVGNQKVCRKVYDRLIFDFMLNKKNDEEIEYTETQTSVGNYFDFRAYAPCGLASKDGVIKKWDDPVVFIDAGRLKAALVWTTLGYFSYKLPFNHPFYLPGSVPEPAKAIEIIFELSALGEINTNLSFIYPPNIPEGIINSGISDVTFWLNDMEIGTYTTYEFSRENYLLTTKENKCGKKKGQYTPKWWRGSNYGELIKIYINNEGTFINNELVSGNAISQYNLKEPYADFKIGIKEDASHIGGFDIYGADFGNYNHDIITRIY
ncbi:MAG: ArsR family transcriptional regulator [Oscillospiraceae bacterium]|nr:ArsR family transcriptional regulator [Oscillospiraceae bacterium]